MCPGGYDVITRNILELLSKISFALHQSKLLELEESRMIDKTVDQEEFQEKIQILSLDELKLYEQLQRKIATQDRSMKIVPDTAIKFPQPKAVKTSDRFTDTTDAEIVPEKPSKPGNFEDDDSDLPRVKLIESREEEPRTRKRSVRSIRISW